MVFSSIIFLFYFLPLALILYFLSPKKIKNYTLLLVSLFFYAWGEPRFVLIMLASIIVNYILGILIEKSINKKSTAKLFLVIGIVLNAGALFVFKYLQFTVDFVAGLLQKIGITFTISLPEFLLPIGLSFFVFQGIAYLVDVYRCSVPAQKNPFKLGLFISMFPKVMQGPIVRYADTRPEIDDRRTTFDDVYEGTQRFIVGLGKKVIVADILASTADSIFAYSGNELTSGLAILGSVCYFFQIFFDFSGYSDMAIGLGRIFGFHFLENFNLPYISKSITEFWRRWHISLGAWFREYIYIPLGGSREGNVYIHLFIVFLLTGIWHGAATTFIVWGIWNGIFVVVERFIEKKLHKKIPAPIGWIYTTLAVFIGWVLFRANSLHDAFYYLRAMVDFGRDITTRYTLPYYLTPQLIVTLAVSIILSFGVPAFVMKKIPRLASVKKFVKPIFLLAILFLSICMLVNGNYSPFIYFKF